MLEIYLWNVIYKMDFSWKLRAKWGCYILINILWETRFKSSYVMVGLTQHKIYWNTLLFKYLLNFRTKCSVWSRVNINSQPEFSTHEMWIVILSVCRKKIFLFLYHTEIKCFLVAPILLNQKASFISVFKWKKLCYAN